MITFTRRSLLAAPFAFTALPYLGRSQAAEDAPHFFLQILLRDGMDNLYLLDNRPKSFTAAGLVPNYMDGDAELWQDSEGRKTLASPLAASALKPWKRRLAVINGVHMPPGFDGHDQNINSLLTNNPFGGVYVGGRIPSKTPFDRVETGNFSGVSLTASESSLSIDPMTAQALSEKARGFEINAKTKRAAWQERLHMRAKRAGEGTSLFAEGAKAYGSALGKTQGLVQTLASAEPSYAGLQSGLEQSTQLALTYFKGGLTRAALVSNRDYNFDAHAIGDAQASEPVFAGFLQDLTAVFRLLEQTAFDEAGGLSMLDVTTVMISSEFGRTFGQSGRPVDFTGTDHNTFANSVFLLGKGVRGDVVIGSTDLDRIEGNRFSEVSGAHQTVDAKLMKKMGRVFDFDRQEPSLALPAAYDIGDYISSISVLNTVFSAFSIPREQWLSGSKGIVNKVLR